MIGYTTAKIPTEDPRPKSKLTWHDAIEQAQEPTDLDRAFEASNWLARPPRLNNAMTQVMDWNIVRERATKLYIEAHEGETAEIEYTDPLFADNVGNRYVYRQHAELNATYVRVPSFHNTDRDHSRTTLDGFVAGGLLIPFSGISRIRVDGDSSVVVL